MNKGLYYICKVLNWVLPMLLVYWIFGVAQHTHDGELVYGSADYVMVVAFCTYILFWIVWFWEYRSGANRIFHEAVILIGMVGTVILAVRYSRPQTFGAYEYESRSLWLIGIIAFSALIVLVRGVTFFSESEKYASKSEVRYRKSLDYNVKLQQDYVANRVKDGDYVNAKKGEMDLEEARRKRDRYYNSQKDDAIF